MNENELNNIVDKILPLNANWGESRSRLTKAIKDGILKIVHKYDVETIFDENLRLRIELKNAESKGSEMNDIQSVSVFLFLIGAMLGILALILLFSK